MQGGHADINIAAALILNSKDSKTAVLVSLFLIFSTLKKIIGKIRNKTETHPTTKFKLACLNVPLILDYKQRHLLG